MEKQMRFDRYLAERKIGTRSEVKALIRKGVVTVDGTIIKEPDYRISPGISCIRVKGKEIPYIKYEYYMLNKPAGILSASKDKRETTVVDLIHSPYTRKLFPVGRLDKDTEGLLLITNDGLLAHTLLSPKFHVDKVYYARIRGRVGETEIRKFAEGLLLPDFKTLPAKLEVLQTGEISEVQITIQEGKFHQIKRMFGEVGAEVIYLKRLSMGQLKLDENLKLGEYRSLTEQEWKVLKTKKIEKERLG